MRTRPMRSAPAASAPPDSPAVLVLRSCRPEQFASAVRLARARVPGAFVVGLTVAGYRGVVLAGGADEAIEIPGLRFSAGSLRLRTLRRLRARKYAEVIVPQMIAAPARHLNVYAVAAAARAERFVIVPGEEPPGVFERRGLLTHMWRAVPEWLVYRFDTPLFIALVIAAWVMAAFPRRVRRAGPRRVVHVVGSLGTGGAQTQLAELLNRTPRDRFDVGLMLLNDAAGSSSQRLIARDLPITRLTRWPTRTLLILEMLSHFRAGRYDLVHAWLPGTNIMAGAAARLARVPCVVTSVRGMSASRRWWYPEWWWRPLDVVASRSADVVTVNAEALVEDCARFACLPPSRVRVVPNGLDPALLQADRGASRELLRALTGAPPDSAFVGTVGRLVHEKDHESFLRMLAQVRGTRPDVHGVVVGEGRLRASLERLRDTLGLACAVTLLGDRRDARQLMAGFDLFVLTSVAEGFPNVLLEAAFLQVPCLATEVGGIREVLGPDATLLKPRDVATCAALVLETLADPARAAARSELVRARALRLFTSERSVATWMSVYEHCLDRRAGKAAHPASTPAPALSAAGER